LKIIFISEPCPPNLYIDMVLIKHFHDHSLVISTIQQQLANMLRYVYCDIASKQVYKQ